METTVQFFTVLCFGLSTATLSSVTSENCRSGIGVYNGAFRLNRQMANLSPMKYAMDASINRAIFYSLMYKWSAYEVSWGHAESAADMAEYNRQPGINYIYMSTAATVHAAPAGVLTSGLFFDQNSSYPNWLPDVYFNMTLPLFGVRADHHTIKDLGSTPESNYTNPAVYPQNEFYQDLRRSNTPHPRQGYVLKYYDLSGSPGLQEVHFFVNKINGEIGKFTTPFFDCGQTNQWMLNAVSMATEVMVRHSMWQALRHKKSVAASTVGVSMQALETPASNNNAVTSARLREVQAELASQDTNRCRNLATPEPPVPLAPDFWSVADLTLTLEPEGRLGLRLAHFISNFFQNNDFSKNVRDRQHIQDVYSTWDYRNPNLPVFTDPMIEVKEDRPLTRRQLVSEVYATLMSSHSVIGVGIFLDEGVFPDSSVPVSAFAWREESPAWMYGDKLVGGVVDVYTEGHDYTSDSWFLQVKQAYTQVSTANTSPFTNGRTVRRSRFGAPEPTPEPVTYTASTYEQGTWLPPHFLCGPRQAGWAASYVSPIIVKGAGQDHQFGGVVKVDAVFTARNASP